jgi:alpha-ketoglutarate-dependent taurine dioxygenase
MNTVTELSTRAGPNLWLDDELRQNSAHWLYHLSPHDLAEIDAATRAFAASGRELIGMQRSDFPLPGLSRALRQIRQQVVHGRGFFLLRGFDPSAYSIAEAAIAFFGIGTYFGEAVSQNAKGHALGHVRDLGFDYSQPTSRGYQTSQRLPYHTDGSDLAGLMCLKTARTGGASSVVSATAIFNEVVKRRPELAELLTHPVYRDRRGEVPEDCEPWYRMPVFNLYREKLLTSYVRSTVRKAQRFDAVPRITPELDEAMDLFDELAADPNLHFDMSFEPGDIQFVNNHYVLHSRTSYTDFQEPERKRHLLRLWLATNDGPALPEPYREFQGLNRNGRPNGYKLSGVDLVAPLDPEDGGPGSSSQRLKTD